MTKSDDQDDSILIARACLSQKARVMLKPNVPATLAFLLLGRSDSMQRFGDAPRLSANECLQTLQSVPGAENAMATVFTFGSDIALDVRPQIVTEIELVKAYAAGGGSKLYEVVYDAIFIGLEFQVKAKRFGTDVAVAVSVITDGYDTASEPIYHQMLHQMTKEVRERRFQLQAVGIGIDGKWLSQLLGFDEAHAHTVQPTAGGVRQAAETSSLFFIQAMQNQVNVVSSKRLSPQARDKTYARTLI